MNTEHELLEEQCNARKDYNGTEYDTLGERLNSDMEGIYNRFNKASLIEYSGETITAKDSFDGSADMVIKGKTLQNLFMPGDLVNSIATVGYAVRYNSQPIVFPNTEVTVVNNNSKTIQLQLIDKSTTPYAYSYHLVPANSKLKITTQPNQQIYAMILRSINNWTDDDKENAKCMILDGDWTNKPTPDYFEGIRSVGELESERNLQIKSCGKNLFDGEIEKGYIDAKTGVLLNDTDRTRGCNYIKVKPNTQYVASINYLSTGCYFWIIGYDENKNAILDGLTTYKAGLAYFENPATSKTFVTTPTTRYIKLCWSGIISEDDQVKLEEGTTLTAYEEYKSSEQGVALTAPLRSLPSGVADMVSFAEKKKINAIGKAIFDGSSYENWQFYTDSENETTTCFYVQIPEKQRPTINDSNMIICDSFIPTTGAWMNTLTEECISESKAVAYIYIRINISKLSGYSSSLTAAEKITLFKTWLQANPITVYYQLAEPVKENIAEELIPLRSFDGVTHIWSECSYIQPDITCKVPTNVQAMIARLQSENANLLENNTSLKASADRLSAENKVQEQQISDLNNVTDYLVQSSLI